MFARTERLLLRPGWREDAPALFHAIADEGIVRNLAQAPWPYGPGDAETFLTRERRPHEPTCLIFLRGDGAPTLVGAVGLGPTPDGGLELGYWIARPYWGRGIATEALAAAIDHAFDVLDVPVLHAGVALWNHASMRTVERLGFRHRGDNPDGYRVNGAPEAIREYELAPS